MTKPSLIFKRIQVRGDYQYKHLYKCNQLNCHNYFVCEQNSINSGHTNSCGCYAIKKRKKPKTHGKTGSSEYQSWKGLIQRCTNPKAKHYNYYGGRGITICNEWLNSFEQFYKDMGDRPKGKTLDRIDSNGNYEPNNCRWATSKEQMRNRRNTI